MIDREFERKLYSLYKLIDFYLNDCKAVELRQYLEDAIKSMLGDLSEVLNQINYNEYLHKERHEKTN